MVFVFESMERIATYRNFSSQQTKKIGCSARTARAYPRPGYASSRLTAEANCHSPVSSTPSIRGAFRQ
jgi:hypothetical protein